MIQLNEYLINRTTKEVNKKQIKIDEFVKALEDNFKVTEVVYAKMYKLQLNESGDLSEYPLFMLFIDEEENTFFLYTKDEHKGKLKNYIDYYVSTGYGELKAIPDRLLSLIDGPRRGYGIFSKFNASILKKILMEYK